MQVRGWWLMWLALAACGGSPADGGAGGAPPGTAAAAGGADGSGGGAPVDIPPPPDPPPPHPIDEWVLQTAPETTPSFGWEAGAAFDPVLRRWIHQGGHDGIPQGSALFTWDFESKTWAQQFPPTSPGGVCVIDGSAAFDRAHRRFVRFPGASLGHGYQFSRSEYLKSSAVWLYDPDANAWTNMRPPLPYESPGPYSTEVLGSLNAGVTYDPKHEVVLSMGGQTAGGGSNSMFVYDAHANLLERLQGANPPAPRDGHGIAYSAKNDVLIVFGSQYLTDETTYVYRYATNEWEALDLEPRPPGVNTGTYATIPKMACNPDGDDCLLVSWDPDTQAHQTWVLDTAAMAWTARSPAASPEPSLSRSRNLDYSPELNLFLLETMTIDGVAQLWTYRARDLDDDPRPGPPSNLSAVTTESGAKLAWTPSWTPGASYRVYRTELGAPWLAEPKPIGETSGAEYEDADLASGVTYLYRVTATTDGHESLPSASARTDPRVLLEPVVSAQSETEVAISWTPHPAPDVVGYNVYRALATVDTVSEGVQAPWKDNDPHYDAPRVARITGLGDYVRLNPTLIAATSFTDVAVDLGDKGPEAGDHAYAVYAYLVRAVNRLGVESGPSPYALTIPAEPRSVLVQEAGNDAQIVWDKSPEPSVVGYRVYRLGEDVFEIVLLTPDPVAVTSFVEATDGQTTRFWITAVDALGQEGQPSSPAWFGHRYDGFYSGDWHQ
jgi:hypothetical protein